MEQRYKNALRQIYREKLIPHQESGSYADDLFKSARSYFIQPKKSQDSFVKASVEPVSSQVKSVTEKTLILDSFHQFGKEKLEENDNKPLSIEGGEIRAKDQEQDGLSHHFSLSSVAKNDFWQYMLDQTSQEITEKRYAQSRFESEKIKVLFVSDRFNQNEQEDISSELEEFVTLFEKATATLFSKMIKAMKLEEQNYLLSAIKFNEEQRLDLVLNEIVHFKPQLIITLGVSASHALLNINKRLKEIHGKFYSIKVNEVKTQVMPLFSPNLLNTAVNMKKIAWEDMQKAMEYLEL